MADTPAKVGRPSSYSQELSDRICARLAAGESMRTVCKDDDMPSAQTLFTWMRVHPEFLEQYTRAKVESADALIEESLDIADDGTNDWMESRSKDEDGDEVCKGWKFNKEHVQRSKLRIETRKWMASKLKPKKYGEKNIHTGPDGEGPVSVIIQGSDTNLL